MGVVSTGSGEYFLPLRDLPDLAARTTGAGVAASGAEAAGD